MILVCRLMDFLARSMDSESSSILDSRSRFTDSFWDEESALVFWVWAWQSGHCPGSGGFGGLTLAPHAGQQSNSTPERTAEADSALANLKRAVKTSAFRDWWSSSRC